MSGEVSTWNVRLAGGEDVTMRESVGTYPRAAVERAMKVQEVILRAMGKKINWWQAGKIIGISDRQTRRCAARIDVDQLPRLSGVPRTREQARHGGGQHPPVRRATRSWNAMRPDSAISS